MSHETAIHDYFRAFRERDRPALERLLKEDFRHVSPWGIHDDRERMLDSIWPSVGQHWAEDIRIYGTGPDYCVRYRHSAGTPMIEYFRFEGEQIAEIEVFAGRSDHQAA